MTKTMLRPLASPARRLYRSLVQPALRPSPATQFQASPNHYQPLRYASRAANARGTTAPPKTPFNDPDHPLDEKIRSTGVHFVDENEGMDQDPETLSYLLKQINRDEEHIQQVGKHSETGLPVVRVRTKRWLRENEQVKEAQKRAQAKTLAAGKELELTWGVDRHNDLEHRLKKLEAWLAEGKSVEILIGQKRGGRKPTMDEGQELIEIVRQRALDIDGAQEAAPIAGSVGGQVILKFVSRAEGKQEGRSTMASIKQERKDKMKKKEDEKAKKRAEAEEKRKRAETRERERMEHLRERAAASG
ncbi:MAG: hypothetical protein Q9162_006094 [Coniocarpon cinnabarinum]